MSYPGDVRIGNTARMRSISFGLLSAESPVQLSWSSPRLTPVTTSHTEPFRSCSMRRLSALLSGFSSSSWRTLGSSEYAMSELSGCACVNTTVSAPITRSGPFSGSVLCDLIISPWWNREDGSCERTKRNARQAARTLRQLCASLSRRDIRGCSQRIKGRDPLRRSKVLLLGRDPMRRSRK